jgi:hypothetical protein
LPTSLTIDLTLLTRGYTPWRPDAVMSTITQSREIQIFKDCHLMQ